MSIPALRRYSKGDRIHVQAHRIWAILTCWVMSSDRDPLDPDTIYYGDLAERMGMVRRAGITLARPLGIVGWYCALNDIPTLNSLVVNEVTDAPGDSVVTRPGKTWRDEQAECMKEDWHSIRTPTTSTLRKVWEANR